MIYSKRVVNNFIKQYLIYYKKYEKSIISRSDKCDALKTEFIDRFPLKKLTLKSYCFEKGKPDSYCYWVDNTLNDLCDIHIQKQGGFQKFHIQKIGKKYKYKRNNQKCSKFGKTIHEVFKTIKQELINIENYSKTFDVKGIRSSMIHQTLRAKLTYIYNSEMWIPICVNNDINDILNYLKISFSKKESLTDKRVILFGFYKEIKKEIPYINTWMFMDFLYNPLGLASYIWSGKKLKNRNSTKNIEYTIKNVKSLVNKKHKFTISHAIYNNDTVESFKQKKYVGCLGETIVYEYLSKHAKTMKITNIQKPGLECRNGEHHDISYVNNKGETIYIEVKATSRKCYPFINFEMSDDEATFMKKNIGNYFIYYIDDIFNAYTIYVIKGAIVQNKIKPCSYRFCGKI